VTVILRDVVFVELLTSVPVTASAIVPVDVGVQAKTALVPVCCVMPLTLNV
jgi:hypothetical protein